MVSFVFGLAAAALAIAPAFAVGGTRSWAFSTIGVCAIVAGVVALRDPNNRRPWRGLLPALGIVFGAFGTLIMAWSLIASYAGGGIPMLQPLEFQGNAVSSAPDVTVPDTTVPERVVDPQAHEAERMSLVQTEETLASLLKQSVTPTGTYPAEVAQTPEGAIVTPAGAVTLPSGSTVSYRLAADASGFSLSMTGPLGAEARYDTASGMISSR